MKEPNDARRKLLIVGLGAVAAQLDLPDAEAQDATKVMPRAYRVALENDQVRVLEFTGRPGMGICGDGMHSHPAHLTVVLSDWKGLATTPDGTVLKRERKQGDVFWAEAETHKLENTGATNSRVLIVELKTAAKPKA
jgi:quercetin dioxygenase-like cupin family protein